MDKSRVQQNINDIKQNIDNCKQTDGRNEIFNILNKIAELPSQVNGVEVNDSWLKNLKRQEQQMSLNKGEDYSSSVYWAICLERTKEYIRKIRDDPKQEDRDNIYQIENNFLRISQIILEGKVHDNEEKEQNSKQRQENYEDIIPKKMQQDRFDVESLQKFYFQKKGKGLFFKGQSRIREAELLEDGGFKVSSKKKPEGKINYVWKNPVQFKLEKKEDNKKSQNDSMRPSQSRIEIEDNKKKDQGNLNVQKDGKGKEEQQKKQPIKQQPSLKWQYEDCEYRVMIKDSPNHQDCYYVYLPDQYAKKVMTFLIFKKAMLNDMYQSNFTLRQLFLQCAIRFRQTVINFWYKNHMQPKCQLEKQKKLIRDRNYQAEQSKYDEINSQGGDNEQIIEDNPNSNNPIKELPLTFISKEEEEDNEKNNEYQNDQAQLGSTWILNEQQSPEIKKNSGKDSYLQSKNSLNILGSEKDKAVYDGIPKNNLLSINPINNSNQGGNQKPIEKEIQLVTQSTEQKLQPQISNQFTQSNNSSQFNLNINKNSLRNVEKTSGQSNTLNLSDNAILLLEFEILSPVKSPQIEKEFYLKYYYVHFANNQINDLKSNLYKVKQNLRLVKQEKEISRYVLQEKYPVFISEQDIEATNDKGQSRLDHGLSLEICIKSNDCKEDEYWGVCQLSFEKYLSRNKGSDFWLICMLEDPRNKSQFHYGFLHLSLFKKSDHSYFDYLQNIIKNDLYLICPQYQDHLYLPFYNPQQIKLVYGLLQVFNYEQNFLGFYKYRFIDNDYVKILNTNNEVGKSFSEYCANIRTFYYYMYMSSVSKIMAYSKIQQEIWLKFEDKLKNKDFLNSQIHSDFLCMCKEGIPIENRFSTWFELSLLIEMIAKSYKAVTQLCKKQDNLQDKQEDLKKIVMKGLDTAEIKRQVVLGSQFNFEILEESIKERCKKEGITEEEVLKSMGIYIDKQLDQKYDIFQRKEDFYLIIEDISPPFTLQIIPEIFTDLNKKFENGLLSKSRISEKYNNIVSVIRDFIFLDTLHFERRLSELEEKKRSQVSVANYHQGLIDIVEKLIILNNTCKTNENRKKYSDIFWTLNCFYKYCLKFYLCSKYQGKQIINHLFMLNYSVKIYMKELWTHLDSLQINTDFLFEKAFLSLFANLFSRELLYRIWDVIFLEISRQKILPCWILISIAMAILFKLKKALMLASSMDDVLLMLKNYCLFEINHNDFIELIYAWIDKLFYHDLQDNFSDEYLFEKILIQQNVLEKFYVKYNASNIYFESEIVQSFRRFSFQRIYSLQIKMEQVLQGIYKQKNIGKYNHIPSIYDSQINDPQRIHLVLHSFSGVLSQNSRIILLHDGLEKQKEAPIDGNYFNFDLDYQKFLDTQKVGSLIINMIDGENRYEGIIELDNLFFDQAIKLNVVIQERQMVNGQKVYKPIGYVLECSILIQTCNTYNLNYSKTDRVSFHYFKNLNNKISLEQQDLQYVETRYGSYSALYPNIIFYQDLNNSELKQKLDTCNGNILTHWKINSYIPLDKVTSFIEELFPDISTVKRAELIKVYADLDNQFYLLDLILSFIIYSQESFQNKATLIFKFLNFFERRRCSQTILDVTVKSFLIAFYERIQYHYPSHQVIATENFIKSKSVSQINFIYYEKDKKSIDLTNFFKQEYFDKVQEKNLTLNLDLSNPDFLQILYNKLYELDFLVPGVLIVDYQQKIYKRQKQIKIIIDQQKSTCALESSLSQEIHRHMTSREKKENLIEKLLLKQKYLINFEVYDTYNETQFIDLLNQMPLIPLLLTIQNVYQENPIDYDQKKMSVNLNMLLEVKIKVDNSFFTDNIFYIRDHLFDSRINFLKTHDGQIPEEYYLLLPNINIYSRIDTIVENILESLANRQIFKQNRAFQQQISAKNYDIFDYSVAEVDGINFDKELFILPRYLSLVDIYTHLRGLDKQIITSWDQNLRGQGFNLPLTISINTQQRRRVQLENIPATFCKYYFQNVEKQMIFLPVTRIYEQKKQPFQIVETSTFSGQLFTVELDDFKNIFVTQVLNKFVPTFESFQQIYKKNIQK